MADPRRGQVGMPPRLFFFTVDQIATMLEATDAYVKSNLLFYEGRDPGIPPKDKMKAINIAPEGEVPEWRISENSLMGFLRRRGVKFYYRGYGS